jgi:uncharacterized protein (DUF1778 family)
MTVQTKEKNSRLNVRLTAKSKERISRAAYILGQDLTEFTETTLNEKAREVIEKYERFELTEAEKKDLFALLDAPVPQPTKKSIAAAKKYKEMIDNGQLIV